MCYFLLFSTPLLFLGEKKRKEKKRRKSEFYPLYALRKSQKLALIFFAYRHTQKVKTIKETLTPLRG
jgi:hypothetical protein